MPSVQFLPSRITVEAEHGETLLRAAMRAGVHINASCGGAGVCNKCRVDLEEGKVKGEEFPDGGWKACATVALDDVVVRVPVESEMDRKALARPVARQAAAWIRATGEAEQWAVEPVVEKHVLALPEPTLHDSVSDLERLRREFRHGRFRGTDILVEAPVLYSLPSVLRQGRWTVTVTLAGTAQSDLKVLTRVEPGDRSGENCAVSIDLGTTTVSVQLLDLTSGMVVGEVSDYNPQVSYGEDVISRMEFARKDDGLRVLQGKIGECLTRLVRELFETCNRDLESLSFVSLAGNTVMSHFLAGLETRYLRSTPYTPVASSFPPMKAEDCGMDLPEHVFCFLAPCVASYVGGDIVAGVVGAGINRDPELTLFIDIGTNGEIVLGNQDWMACAACSAGPAFEGGGIRHGMRATTGAVEVVHIHPGTYEPMVLTIGGRKAKGICGSGIISLLAGLFTTGAIDRQGKFCKDLGCDRIRPGRDGWEYVVVEKSSSATGDDIVFTEADIENLIRAKGAMFAGYLTLLESVGMSLEDLERVVLAGNFGSYIDLEQAIVIGLLPDIPRDRFFFAGNSSLLGAKAGALSKKAMAEFDKVAEMMTHFDLSGNAQFMDHYVSSLFLPHTDAGLFPSVNVAG